MKEFPKPLPLRKLLGPSFIILGVGLGSGELILWPYLASNFGLGIAWAAIIGITFQFFINMEIERYTLVRGESIFSGLTTKFGKWVPYWFMLSTFVPWMWPGIMASSATALSAAFNLKYSPALGIGLLLLLGILYSFGKIVYKTQERVQKAIILIGVPFIFLITILFARTPNYEALSKGILGIGENYYLLPATIPIATFLTALAYAGAGGNLNLAQSLYIREKGYGMGMYSGKITNLLMGAKENVELTETRFEENAQNLLRFRIWWRRINIEHAIVFLLTGAFTMMLLMLLAHSTVYGNQNASTSINFMLLEARVIGERTLPFLGSFFLVMASLMLFGTQFAVYGSNARIMSENLYLANKKLFPTRKISLYFFILLWVQIIAGIIIFSLGFTEPLALLVISGILNAFSMFIYTGLIWRLNTTELSRATRPSGIRVFTTLLAFLFYGGFCLFTIILNLQKIF